ncbi:MAG: phosphoribosylamine--glycine ligase [Elusimicrobia bacterium]|nr:phosphoribosylamine--glycine ligase [Elusimicrobiota bacterium]
MNVLVIGSGGREHALLWKLSQSPRAPRLFALPGSTAIGKLADCLTGADPLNPPAVVELCKEHAIDLVVIGPEAPLAAGLSDGLEAFGIAVFGPGHAAARLESSKAFAKDFMKRHGIPTAEFEVYDDPARAQDAAAELPLPLVVKADGLAAGKGVRVCRGREEALKAVQDFMLRGAVGEAGKRLVLERCLEGPEASVLAFVDGERWTLLPVARDHKRLLDGDGGPNTGGMGAYAPAPDVDAAALARIEREVLAPVLAGLKADRLKYRGLLYCGLMLTPQGPRVIEFNVRFGDPETQALLPLVENDLLDVLEACARGRLDQAPLAVRRRASVCVALASEGYPEQPVTSRRIHGIEGAEMEPDVLVFHAGTRRSAEGWLTAGGRVLNVVATAPDLERARTRAYAAAARIHFDGVHYRKDIAAQAPAKG